MSESRRDQRDDSVSGLRRAFRLALRKPRVEEEVKTLRGLLPICSYCKRIRDDQGYWKQIEVYIAANSHADFSHGMCPECGIQHYPDIFKEGAHKEQPTGTGA